MRIEINKDFLMYKDEALKGYTFIETVAILLALISAVGTGVIMVYYFNMSVNTGVYTGVLVIAAPILFGAFYKYQGMSCMELLREQSYVNKTKLLIREADEYHGYTAFFSMKKSINKNVPTFGTKRKGKNVKYK